MSQSEREPTFSIELFYDLNLPAIFSRWLGQILSVSAMLWCSQREKGAMRRTEALRSIATGLIWVDAEIYKVGFAMKAAVCRGWCRNRGEGLLGGRYPMPCPASYRSSEGLS